MRPSDTQRHPSGPSFGWSFLSSMKAHLDSYFLVRNRHSPFIRLCNVAHVIFDFFDRERSSTLHWAELSSSMKAPSTLTL